MDIFFVKKAQAADLGQNYAFGGFPSLGEGFTYLVRPGFEIAASLVLIFIVIGAFKYLLSGGDKEAVSKARAMITHSIIAFFLLILAFVILQFIPEFLRLEGFKIVR